MLPAVLQWNAAVNGERQKALSEAMGAPDRPASELVKELIAGLDQPTSCAASASSARTSTRSPGARSAITRCKVNPRPIKTEADVMEILELAW